MEPNFGVFSHQKLTQVPDFPLPPPLCFLNQDLSGRSKSDILPPPASSLPRWNINIRASLLSAGAAANIFPPTLPLRSHSELPCEPRRAALSVETEARGETEKQTRSRRPLCEEGQRPWSNGTGPLTPLIRSFPPPGPSIAARNRAASVVSESVSTMEGFRRSPLCYRTTETSIRARLHITPTLRATGTPVRFPGKVFWPSSCLYFFFLNLFEVT